MTLSEAIQELESMLDGTQEEIYLAETLDDINLFKGASVPFFF
jgi:hypothetical protein